jgi:DNA helicase-2/ATP-dependent DNA helicase PcrA
LIDQNTGRLGKELWTDMGDGDPIQLYAGYNEIDEARYIVERIKSWSDSGNLYSESAILYRSNAQSRVLEEALLRAQMPYRIYGGQRFFERVEIRNVLAYMRLVGNRDADAAFERVVNTPPRGIGGKSVAEIRLLARAAGIPLWQAATKILDEGLLTGRARKAIAVFLGMIETLDEQTAEADLGELVEVVVEASGLKDYHAKEGGERGQARVENMAELVTAAKTYDPSEDYLFDADPDEQEAPTLSVLDDFLSHAALEAGEGQGDPDQDCVQLMTMHSAKGLEFPLVFLAGLEDGLFPHMMSLEEPGRLEEERRLCYVGVTRAMRQLYLTYAESRRINGSETFNRPSRFISEMPEEVIKAVRPQKSVVYPRSSPSPRSSSSRVANEVVGTNLKIGQRVVHQKFGEGVILNYEGEGSSARVQVNFSEGSKWLVMGYANLEALG